MSTVLFIKYMVSLRCKMKVKEELERLGLHCVFVDLGYVEVKEKINEEKKLQLRENLKASGLILLDDKRSILIERIKNTIIEMIHFTEDIPRVNYSDYISEKVGQDYTYLANIFSEVKGMTIQQYIINNKIEKAKEMLIYEEFNLKEISYKLHYSSPAHFSNQFKKVTGLTPIFFRKLKERKRSPLEDL